MKTIKKGDFYQDCGYIPRLCIDNDGESLEGISLIDGSIGYCSIRHCAPKKRTALSAVKMVKFGPLLKKNREKLKQFYAGE